MRIYRVEHYKMERIPGYHLVPWGGMQPNYRCTDSSTEIVAAWGGASLSLEGKGTKCHGDS